MTLTLDVFSTLFAATAVLLLGRWLLKHVPVLARYSIPEPVAGGLLAALLMLALHAANIAVQFSLQLQMPLLLMFFCTIGLAADIPMLRRGGKPLVRFIAVVVGFLFVQNMVGVGMALVLGIEPLLGLIGGSITLSGGHGTGVAWAEVFDRQYSIEGVMGLAMACATFGLVLGGLVGGPVARFLVQRLQKNGEALSSRKNDEKPNEVFEAPRKFQLITAALLFETLFLMALALSAGTRLAELTRDSAISLPDFVWVLFCGVIVGNTVRLSKIYQPEERALTVVGNTCLGLFLAMALMSLKLWELAALAGPLFILLTVQTAALVAYVVLVTYPVMGRNYDAAVLAAGQCGFGLGATPTAIANMQAITDRYGPSHLAFLLVPIVGAFFIDIANALVVKAFLSLPLLLP
ncbi:MAG: sodium/glutamate symporter [Pedobacter sp.]|nr:sodium/glutamate symporter [Pedobacter sp.]